MDGNKDHRKIIFFGTPQFAIPSLDILNKHFNIVAVVTAVDKPQGRHNKIIPSPVKEYALAHDIPLLQPEKLRDENFLQQLDELDADLFIVVAFRMLPACVWKKPKLGTINLHGALLPKYRGAAPINWAIINGEEITGVTTFFIDENIDTGKMILQDSTKIFSGDNFETLYDRLKFIGAKTILNTVNAIFDNTFTPIDQPKLETSLAPKIEPEDCFIDFNKSTEQVYNFVRGMFPNAWFYFKKNMRCKILEAYPIDLNIVEPGNFFSDKKKFLYIGTQDGVISVERLQLEGKKEMDIKSFLAGNAKLL